MATTTISNPPAPPGCGIALAAGQTASQTVELQNLGGLGLVVVITISAFTSGTLTVTLSGVSASGAKWTILASAGLGAAATTVLKVGLGVTPATNVAASDLVPNNVEIAAVVSGGGSLTYGIDYSITGTV